MGSTVKSLSDLYVLRSPPQIVFLKILASSRLFVNSKTYIVWLGGGGVFMLGWIDRDKIGLSIYFTSRILA